MTSRHQPTIFQNRWCPFFKSEYSLEDTSSRFHTDDDLSQKSLNKKHVFNFFRKLICVFTERISKGIGAATVQALVPTEVLTRGICSWSRSLERSVFTFPDGSSMFRIYTGCPLITGTQIHLGYAQIYWVLFGSLNLLFCAGFVIRYF